MSASLIVDMNIESDLSESGDEFEREVKKRLHNKEKEKQKLAIGDLATTHSHVLVNLILIYLHSYPSTLA